MTELARNFRKEPTQSEAILWQAIRNRQLDGRKFRRQQPVGAFVLDFYCADERLAVEVDGRIHETQQEADRLRQELIEELGIRFVRVTAEAVEKNLSSVLQQIRSVFLRSAPSSPGPFSHSGEKGSNPDGEKSPLSPRSSGRGDLGVREESPATYWNNPEMQNLVD
ncbi:MAG: endonuclease domain-containing protein, partial [Anaerolineaceae bacterium]